MSEKHYPWWHPVMGDAEKSAVCSVIDNSFPNDGPITSEFERKVAEIVETKYAIAVTSCTAGLYLSLKAKGIGPGDEVLVPDITFIATANAVAMTGATPVLTDVSMDTFCIDVSSLEKLVNKRTKAVIPVHVSGRPAAMTQLSQFAERHNLFIIEDAAEALGSKLNGKPLGSLGLTGCFSFSPAKTITTGQGGIIVTSDDETYGRLVELKDQGRPKRGTGGDDIHVSIGFNFKFTDLQASVGCAQLSTFNDRVIRLRRHYELYRDNLATNSERLRIPRIDLDGGTCPQWVDVYCEDRDSLYDHLKENRMDCRKFWHPIHTQRPYRNQDTTLFPNAVKVSENSLWLPSALSLTDEDILAVCKQINSWATKRTSAAMAV